MIEKYTNEEIKVARNPSLYYAYLDLMKSVEPDQLEDLAKLRKEMKAEIAGLKNKHDILSSAARNFMEEVRMSTRKNGRIDSLEQMDDLMNSISRENLNFIVLLAELTRNILGVYEEIYHLSGELRPINILTSKKRYLVGDSAEVDSQESFQGLLMELELNGPAIESYVKNLHTIGYNKNVAENITRELYKVLESYYKMLLHRHTSQGIQIFRDPVITDVAIRIYENVDSHGEIESGKNKDQVSAYTIRKAEVLAKALKDEMVHKFISAPGSLISFIGDAMHQVEGFMERLNDIYEPQLETLQSRLGGDPWPKSDELDHLLGMLEDLNPANIAYREPTTVKSETDALVDNVKNETLGKITEMLLDSNVQFKELISYILERKAELKKFFHEENSFYVCKIGGGNPFSGEAPGSLHVVPAARPQGNLDYIVGSGFKEVKEFAQSIESAAKWRNLFVATSPSKTADKSNILLIGPMGCGKTEVMRAVGGDKKSIGIFAQGSDFGTCWAGEAEKNPKRMFEEGIKLNKESGRHVHFLIDEIDAVLNNDQSNLSTFNLTLEFQILMDGVVAYPNLSVWGATNNPERIPMPMIRRFNKVLIVGELNNNERVFLLKHFLNHMPMGRVSDKQWEDWGKKLTGATGDIIRKVADYLWRKKMNEFVMLNATAAETVVKYLESKGEFSVEKFDRDEFKKTLGEFIKITPADVELSIQENLSNMAIITEIKTAVATYENAKTFLLKANKTVTTDVNSNAL